MKETCTFVTANFTYTDEFGNTTSVCKSVANDYMGGSELDVLGDLFKDFIMACGFNLIADRRVAWIFDDR